MKRNIYCTNCKFGEELINSILNELKRPIHCDNCNPCNPEDSTILTECPNYIQLT